MSRYLWFSIVLTVVIAGFTLFLYGFGRDYMPEQVPVHWNIEGKADSYVPRERVLPYLMIAPGVMALLVLLTLALPWLSPKPFSIERFRSTYDYIMALIVGLFGYVQITLLLASIESPLDSTRLVVGGIFLFFAALGNVLGKVRRNFYVGVRTPWTIANEQVWNQTHRVAAWLYVPLGLIGFTAVVLGVNLSVVFVVFMIGVLLPVPYSLYLYKRLEREGKLESPSGSIS
jgi:uncharacterized membrane protein